MNLDIYVDEGGLAPMADDDEPFVAASVALVDSPAIAGLPLEESNGRDLIEHLHLTGANLGVAYVAPGSGYGAALGRRLAQLDVMSWLTRRTTGENAAFVEPDGLRERNVVWNHVIEFALATALLDVLHRRFVVPARVRVFCQRKSLSPQTRARMERTVARLPLSIHQAADRLAQSRDVRTRNVVIPQDGPMQITVEFEDDLGFAGASGGIWLAHSVASGMFRALCAPRSREVSVRELLNEAEFGDSIVDVTQMLMQPVHPSNVEQWERQHGIVLPW